MEYIPPEIYALMSEYGYNEARGVNALLRTCKALYESYSVPQGTPIEEWTMDKAVNQRYWEVMRILYENGGFLSGKYITPIVESGNMGIIKWYYDHRPNDISNILATGAKCGNLEVVKWAYSVAYGINTFKDSTHILDNAFGSGNIELVEWLYSKGYPYSHIAVRNSIRYGKMESILWLDNDGAKMGEKVAIEELMGGSPEIAQFFYDRGINLPDTQMSKIIAKSYCSLLEWVVEKNPDYISYITKQITYYRIAINNDDADIFRLLMSMGTENTKITTIFKKIIEIGNLRLLEILCEFVELPNLGTFYIEDMVRLGHLDILIFLYEKGYNISEHNILGFAFHHGKREILTWGICSRFADTIDLLGKLIYRGDMELASLAIEEGYYTNYHLSKAVRGGNTDMVKYMLELGYESTDDLLYEAWIKNIHIIPLLVNYGYTTNRDILDYSFRKSINIDEIKVIVECGITTDRDILSAAVRRNHPQLMKFLFEHGYRSSLPLVNEVISDGEYGIAAFIHNSNDLIKHSLETMTLYDVIYLLKKGETTNIPILDKVLLDGQEEIAWFIINCSQGEIQYEEDILMSAIKMGKESVVRYLLKEGITIRNTSDNRLINMALEDDRIDLAHVLTTFDISSIPHIITHGDVARWLYEKGFFSDYPLVNEAFEEGVPIEIISYLFGIEMNNDPLRTSLKDKRRDVALYLFNKGYVSVEPMIYTCILENRIDVAEFIATHSYDINLLVEALEEEEIFKYFVVHDLYNDDGLVEMVARHNNIELLGWLHEKGYRGPDDLTDRILNLCNPVVCEATKQLQTILYLNDLGYESQPYMIENIMYYISEQMD